MARGRTLGGMGIDEKNIDRLLPRHESAENLDLTWDVRMERSSLFKKEEISTRAAILDISLEGALVKVHADTAHEIDEKVIVRFRGMDGLAIVKHRRAGDDGTMLFGVRFLPEPTFKGVVDHAVGELSGHPCELATAWQPQN
jgi:hypothetical protein